VRFAAGVALGTVPLFLPPLVGWPGPVAGYAYWAPNYYGTLTAPFSLGAAAANAPDYAATLLGVHSRVRFFPIVVPCLALVGAASTLRRRGVRGHGALVVAILLQVGLALGYFFHDRRLLLPVLPLVLIFAARGLARVAAWRAWVGVSLAVAAIALQMRASSRTRSPERAAEPIAPVLRTIAVALPREALVASDVSPLLAWLYWIRGSERTFLPVEGRGRVTEHPLTDRHVRVLHVKSATRTDVRPPTTLLVDGTIDRATVMDGRRPIVAVLCTARGRRELAPRLAGELRPWRTLAGCELLASRTGPESRVDGRR